jgi:phospholipid/cholesterol/gamma-HCH transport system substrate-binding protein
MERTKYDFWIGLFLFAGFFAMLWLSFKVGNLGTERAQQVYTVKASFENIGGL